jgi:hypothetical protein
MYETQTPRYWRCGDPDRADWDELLTVNRALIKAMTTGKPMTRKDARIVAEYLREAGWTEARSAQPRRKQVSTPGTG